MACKNQTKYIGVVFLEILQPPKNQTAEVLYELLTNGPINRRDILINTGILNVTARISDIRKHGINVKCEMIKTKNKHNRSISFGKWSIDKNISVVDVYNKINV